MNLSSTLSKEKREAPKVQKANLYVYVFCSLFVVLTSCVVFLLPWVLALKKNTMVDSNAGHSVFVLLLFSVFILIVLAVYLASALKRDK